MPSLEEQCPVATWPWTSSLQNQLMTVKHVCRPFGETLLSSLYDTDPKTRGSTVAFTGPGQVVLAPWSNALPSKPQVERSGKPGRHVSDMADKHEYTLMGWEHSMCVELKMLLEMEFIIILGTPGMLCRLPSSSQPPFSLPQMCVQHRWPTGGDAQPGRLAGSPCLLSECEQTPDTSQSCVISQNFCHMP